MGISQQFHWKQEASRLNSERVREHKSMRNDVLAMLRADYNDVFGDGDEVQYELQREWETGLRHYDAQATTTRITSQHQRDSVMNHTSFYERATH